MTFSPIVEGTFPIRASAADFLAGLHRRVTAGLLTGQPHARSNYVVTDARPNHLRVEARDWWTAANVGLNELDVQVSEPGVAHFHVRYWRWAGYALSLGAALGVIGLAPLLLTDARSYIASHRTSMIPGLSIDQNLQFAWVMVLFWGFIWPWLLIVLHQRPVRRLVECLIREVDAATVSVGAR
ncbi:MAG: hypothetical protein HY038_02650 [Nitrospirae bacterium]|nr:hypothetical protein [Nitrospirota bacterium]